MSGISQPFVRTVTFTRPADTTAYTAGDGVSDATTTATAATFVLSGVGTSGVIQSVTLHKSSQNLTNGDFDIYFFDTQPAATGFDDNAAIAITDAEFLNCLGVVTLTASGNGASVVTGDFYGRNNVGLAYQCATASNSLYVVIVARAAYTPASAEVITLRVGGLAN